MAAPDFSKARSYAKAAYLKHRFSSKFFRPTLKAVATFLTGRPIDKKAGSYAHKVKSFDALQEKGHPNAKL